MCVFQDLSKVHRQGCRVEVLGHLAQAPLVHCGQGQAGGEVPEAPEVI